MHDKQGALFSYVQDCLITYSRLQQVLNGQTRIEVDSVEEGQRQNKKPQHVHSEFLFQNVKPQ